MIVITRKLFTLVAGFVLMTSSLAATNFMVTKTADTADGTCDADCSLREAVIAANASAGTDTITLPSGTYALSLTGAAEDTAASGDLDITDDLIINGAARDTTVINGQAADRIFHVIQSVAGSPVSLSLSQLTVRNGKNISGAALNFRSDGGMTINDVLFTKNYALNGWGGAIKIRAFNSLTGFPTLNMNNSIVTENCATSGAGMEGVGTWNINGSTISKNGGPFTPEGGTLINCDVYDWGGGGMYLQAVDLNLKDSSITDNVAIAGGGINSNCCEVNIRNSTIARNKAYGVGTVAFSKNGGGGLWITGVTSSAIINNSTITDNEVGDATGGLGGGVGISTFPAISARFSNTLLAGNTGVNGPDCFGPAISLGNTLLGDASGCTYTAAGDASDLSGAAGLAAFSNNGQPGNGHYPLLATSAAVDTGNNMTCETTDQLGLARPADGDNDTNAVCDIGAIERPGIPPLADVCPSGCSFTSIQAAINAAATGGTIKVGNGHYSEAITIDSGKILVSLNGPAVTVINALGLNSSVVTMDNATLDGFMITGGSAVDGGGILASGGKIKNNVIEGNSASGNGGGLHFRFNRSIVTGNIIRNNTAGSRGGGVYTNAYLIFSGNTVEANSVSTSSRGGGIYQMPYRSVVIEGNVFKGNAGAAIAVPTYAYGQIRNNLIFGNYIGVYFGIYSHGLAVNNTITGNTYGVLNGGGCQAGCPQVSNSIVWGNTTNDVNSSITVTYSILGVSRAGTGNIAADPLFVVGGDYRLKAASPAIDSGRDAAADGVTLDRDGKTRPRDGDGLGAGSTGDGSDYDIGAYEY